MKYVAIVLVLLCADSLVAQRPQTPPGLQRKPNRAASNSRIQRPVPQASRAVQARSGRALFRGKSQQNRMVRARNRTRTNIARRSDQDTSRRTMRQPIPAPSNRRLTGPERALQQRLAAIDRMRDRAIEADSVEMLNRADRLERMARAQYEHMVREERRVSGGRQRDQDLVPPVPPQQNNENVVR